MQRNELYADRLPMAGVAGHEGNKAVIDDPGCLRLGGIRSDARAFIGDCGFVFRVAIVRQPIEVAIEIGKFAFVGFRIGVAILTCFGKIAGIFDSVGLAVSLAFIRYEIAGTIGTRAMIDVAGIKHAVVLTIANPIKHDIASI